MTYSKICDVVHFASLQSANINLTFKLKKILFFIEKFMLLSKLQLIET